MRVSAGILLVQVKSVMNTRTSLGSHSGFAMTTLSFLIPLLPLIKGLS